MNAPMTTPDWYTQLKAAFPAMVAGMKSKSKSQVEPRDVLKELLTNSLAVLKDPQHTVTKRKKQLKPEVCYTVTGDKAEVTLRYCRQPVAMPDGSTALTVPVLQLQGLLQTLISVVESNAFDDQLNAIKAKRVATLKGANKNAAAVGSSVEKNLAA